MGFKSVNEVDKFRYDDCCIIRRKNTEKDIVLEVEALIVKSDNSQNSNFTESYADVTHISFENGKLLKGVKEGLRMYDANEKLIEEVPDVVLDENGLKQVWGNLGGMYLQGIEKVGETNEYVLFLEQASGEEYDTLPSDTYQVKIACDNIVIRWDRYMNRVQQI